MMRRRKRIIKHKKKNIEKTMMANHSSAKSSDTADNAA